jgi:hypothetical protein
MKQYGKGEKQETVCLVVFGLKVTQKIALDV